MEPEEIWCEEIEYEQGVTREVLDEQARLFIWLFAPPAWTLEQATKAKQKIENIILAKNELQLEKEIGV